MSLNGNLVLLNESLLQEAVLLVVLADTAVYHLVDDLLRLRLGSGLVLLECLDEEDLLLLCEGSLVNVGLVEEGRIHSSSLHADVLAELLNGLVVLQVVRNLQSNQNADYAAHVVVGNVNGGVVETLETADLQVLADGQNLLLESVLNGALAHLAGLQSLNVSRSVLDNDSSQIANELLEVSVLCNEVGLRVNLDDRAYAALVAYSSLDQALSSDAVSLLGSLGQALLAEKLDCLVEVAVSLGQSLLAVHHAYAGHFAELLYVSSGKSHFKFLQFCICTIKNVGHNDHGAPGRRALRTTHLNLYRVMNYSAFASSALASTSSCSPCLPSRTALAMVWEMSLIARIASSLPGIT